MINSKNYNLLMKMNLTNQFSVKAKKQKNAGGLHFPSPRHCNARGAEGLGEISRFRKFQGPSGA
jgi:hypothetical protein